MTAVAFVSRFGKCHDCGLRFVRWNPNGAPKRADGLAYGCSYCRPCMGRRVRANQAKPSGVLLRCDGCAAEYEPPRRKIYDRTAAGARRNYCSDVCHAEANRISKDGLCVAPCEPRCQRLAVGSGLCQGHEKRRDRGRPLNTPLSERQSAALLSSPKAIAYRESLRGAAS